MNTSHAEADMKERIFEVRAEIHFKTTAEEFDANAAIEAFGKIRAAFPWRDSTSTWVLRQNEESEQYRARPEIVIGGCPFYYHPERKVFATNGSVAPLRREQQPKFERYIRLLIRQLLARNLEGVEDIEGHVGFTRTISVRRRPI